MKIIGLKSLLALSLGASLSLSTYASVNDVDKRMIIKFNYPVSLQGAAMAVKSLTNFEVKSAIPMAGGAYVVTLDSAKTLVAKEKMINQALVKLSNNGSIAYAVEDRVGHFKPVKAPTESKYVELSHDLQWDEFGGPAGVMLESKSGAFDGAWSYTQGQGANEPVVVAVLDTGIEENPSLVDNIVKDENGKLFGWNFANNNDDLSDYTGGYHGTHVAGTIAGYGNVMQGMGPELKILAAKIPDASGMFYESAVINAIYWSVGGEVPGVPTNIHPAKVLNMSFGVDERPGKEIDYCDEALQEAMWYARRQGAVVAVAAGNDNRWEHFNAPAVCNGTVKIASTGPKGLRSYFSNYGPGVSFAAPGGDKSYGITGGILSTVKPGHGYMGSGYDFYQGTSMATPHVAGLAGLIFAAAQDNNKTLSAQDVETIMYVTTHDFGKSNDDNDSCVGAKPCGHGIIDANNAVKSIYQGYNHFFTAPKLDRAIATICSKGIKPQQKVIVDKVGQWQLLHTACQSPAKIAHPHVSKEEGKIIAHYGNVTYQLKPNYQYCDIVGFDGIACH